jgi:hypothetical protein
MPILLWVSLCGRVALGHSVDVDFADQRLTIRKKYEFGFIYQYIVPNW